MSIIDNLKTETLSVTRYATGDWTTSKGRYTPGSNSVLSVVASVQPMTPKETRLLPEHLRNRGIIKLYTETELKPVSPTNNTLADTFTWRGNDYVVWGVESWINTDIPHYKVIAFKKDANEDKR